MIRRVFCFTVTEGETTKPTYRNQKAVNYFNDIISTDRTPCSVKNVKNKDLGTGRVLKLFRVVNIRKIV